MTNDGDLSYFQRQKLKNVGEEIFETYCASKNYNLKRIGFDEKRNNIHNFFHLNVALRNIPDYILDTGDTTFVVNVKGTANFKKSEIDLLPFFMEWYSSKKAPLIYAFCFDTIPTPIMLYPEQIIEKYNKLHDRQWKDGAIYRNLNFE